MTPRLHITGAWPSPIVISSGWSKASARPWCDDPGTALVRLIRGSSSFLSAATDHLIAQGAATVLSPPLYRSAASLWRRSGFDERHRLEIMERALSLPSPTPEMPVIATADPPWPEIVDLDHHSFEGIWRMSEIGLKEALSSTRVATVLLTGGGAVEGYALVGAQWGVSYLHRVAVAPSSRGRGVGTDLVRAAIRWARTTLSRAMVLNLRPVNEEARRLYLREGFTPTGHDLHLFGYGV